MGPETTAKLQQLRLTRPSLALETSTDIVIQDLNAARQAIELKYPAENQLFVKLGIHPDAGGRVTNPYTSAAESESFANVYEHCIAVATCALRIATPLVEKGILTQKEADQIGARAYTHDITKPYEILRNRALKNTGAAAGSAYLSSAYEALAPLLSRLGISKELCNYLVRCGTETGHNSLASFIDVAESSANRFPVLKTGMLAEKIVHLADDMTFTSLPTERDPAPITIFMTAWERMVAANFITRYPEMWRMGLAIDSSSAVSEVDTSRKDLPATSQVLGTYAGLQVHVADQICRELSLLIGYVPGHDERPELFIRRLVTHGLRQNLAERRPPLPFYPS